MIICIPHCCSLCLQAKQHVINWIGDFIQDHICKAMTAISQYAEKKIQDGDVILTYGRSVYWCV